MDHGQMRLKVRVRQVRVVGSQLRRGKHPLVDDDLGGQAANVKQLGLLQGGVAAQRVTGAFPDHVQLPLKGLDRQAGRRGNEELLDVRLGRPRRRANVRNLALRGHLVPAQTTLPLLGNDRRHHVLAVVALPLVLRQKHQSGRELARLGQPDVQVRSGDLDQEIVRQRRQNARPVPRIRFAATRPPVIHVDQGLARIAHDLVTAATLDVRHESDSAAFLLVGRIVESVLRRITRCGTACSPRHRFPCLVLPSLPAALTVSQ